MAKKFSMFSIYQTVDKVLDSILVREALGIKNVRPPFRVKTDSQKQGDKVIQIRPHIPLIKFPKREPINELQHRPVGNPNSIDTLIAQNVTSGKPAPTSSGSTKTKGPSIETAELPIRFRRKPLSNEEMEYIEKGGPV